MATLSDPLGWFTLRFPDEWQRVTEDCVTILKSPCGTVYVSGGRRLGGRKAGFGAATFLTDFLQFIGIAVPETAIQSWTGGEGQRVYHYLRESHGRHWRYFSVTDSETALLISYTCDAADAGRECDEVDGLIASVRLSAALPLN